MSGRLQRPVKRRPRVIEKTAQVVIEPVYRPTPEARERLVDLLVELLDGASHSEGR